MNRPRISGDRILGVVIFPKAANARESIALVTGLFFGNAEHLFVQEPCFATSGEKIRHKAGTGAQHERCVRPVYIGL